MLKLTVGSALFVLAPALTSASAQKILPTDVSTL